MSDKSAIEWLNGGATWNVVRGCSRASRGCGEGRAGGCYAERMAHRFSGPGKPYEGLTRLTADGPRWTGEVRCVPEMMDLPIHWGKPRLIFVNSMGDLFHDDVPVDFIAQVFAVMALAPRHRFLVLTKRARRMAQIVGDLGFRMMVQSIAQRRGGDRGLTPSPVWPLPNVRIGVSVEDQAAADARIPHLLSTPAAVRWLSCEPLLGHVNLRRVADPVNGGGYVLDALEGRRMTWENRVPDRQSMRSPVGRLDWIVVGGESGPRSRPMHPGWARSLRTQCTSSARTVPFFFKAWRDWRPNPTPFACVRRREDAGQVVRWGESRVEAVAIPGDANDDAGDAELLQRVGKGAAGRALDGRTWDEMPERRVTPRPDETRKP